ncbi:MAG: hypothetical protein EOO73_24675 [Myxococcales bacterium]|nr:MAG: hypothetical protein EOO73_24675 [Myxococcales bacterium]
MGLWKMPSVPTRRWSKRTRVLTVLGLVLATAVLTVGMVGFARSIGFVTGIGAASEALNEVGQISPDVTIAGRSSVTPGANPPGLAADALPDPGTVTPPVAAPRSGGGAASGGAAIVAAEAEAAGSAGIGGNAGGGGMAGGGGTAGDAGAGGTLGGGGAAPSGWDGAVQSMLTLLGQNTTQMCGPNTCNVGQVCCNFSCGTCVAPGATCDRTVCAGAATTPTAARCGSGQCNDGQVCCNPSCGICAAPGETCSSATCP